MDIKSPVAEARNQYQYSAGGQKLRVTQKWNPNYSTAPVIGSTVNTSALTLTQTTDYVGNKVYQNGTLKRIHIPGGYIEKNVYYYYQSDHLGSNRVTASSGYSDQKVHYYPFGSLQGGAYLGEMQPYKYNGKELDKMHGLNLYDYSARYYEPAIGRFTTVDPLAEKYYNISPYAYVANNPIKRIGPTGMYVYSTSNTHEITAILNKLKGVDENKTNDDPPNNQSSWDEILGAAKETVNEILYSMGVHHSQINSENPAVLKDASFRRIQAAENIETANNVMLMITPSGGIAEVLANANLGNYSEALAALPLAALDAGTGGKGSSFFRGAKASGWIQRSIYRSLDPSIQKKAADAIRKGIVAPTGNTGIIKLTASEAAQTGFQYKVKILGKGGDIRIYGNPMENGHIYFNKIFRH